MLTGGPKKATTKCMSLQNLSEYMTIKLFLFRTMVQKNYKGMTRNTRKYCSCFCRKLFNQILHRPPEDSRHKGPGFFQRKNIGVQSKRKQRNFYCHFLIGVITISSIYFKNSSKHDLVRRGDMNEKYHFDYMGW